MTIKDLNTNIHSRFTHNIQNLEMTQMFVHILESKQIMLSLKTNGYLAMQDMDHIHTCIYNMYINIHIKTQKPEQHLVC